MASLNRPRGKPPPPKRSCVAATTDAVAWRYGTLIRMAAPAIVWVRMTASSSDVNGPSLSMSDDREAPACRCRAPARRDTRAGRPVPAAAGRARSRAPTPPRGARAPAAAAGPTCRLRESAPACRASAAEPGASRPPGGRGGARCRAARSAAPTPWRRTRVPVLGLRVFDGPRGSHCRVRIGIARPEFSPGPARPPADQGFCARYLRRAD